MKNIVTILLLFLALQLTAQEKVNWVSFEEAIKLNKNNPRLMLIDVYTDWCGWCKKMDKTTYENDFIVNYINKNFYAVKLDGEGKNDIVYNDYTFKFKSQGRRGYHELAASLLNGKLSYPTTVFLNDKMQLLDRVPGYLDTKLMEQIVTYFATKKYQTVKWDDYIKNFKSNL